MSDRKINIRTLGILALIGVAITLSSFDDRMLSYRFPVEPFRNLSGTFGELRGDHFHTGMDIKIGGRVGTPIYAIEEGYIARIKVSHTGFGNAIYLRHPDGNYSVYAHLDRFPKNIQSLVYQRQLAAQKFNQEIYPKPNEIAVNKGEIIGYGGNSGYSFGPHLHFEIRDERQRILNPLLYYRDKIRDDIPPIVQSIAFEPLDYQSRVFGKFEKWKVKPAGRRGNYLLKDTVLIDGPVGLEYRAYDLLNGAGNHCGINRVRLFLDGKLIHEMDVWRFSFNENRYIQQHFDYSTYINHRQYYEKAYIDHGNRFSAYSSSDTEGRINLQDSSAHSFLLELSDGHENTTKVQGFIKRAAVESVNTSGMSFSKSPIMHYELKRNALVIRAECPLPEMREGIFCTNEMGLDMILEPQYTQFDEFTYILPLDSVIYPFSVSDHRDSTYFQFHFQQAVSPSTGANLRISELSLSFPPNALYKSFHIPVKPEKAEKGSLSDTYYIGKQSIPLHKEYTLNFTLNPDFPLKHAIVAMKDDDGTWTGIESEKLANGSISAKSRSFGAYAVRVDSTPPVFRPLNFKNNERVGKNTYQLRVKIEDDLAGLDPYSITGTLDGVWVLWEYSLRDEMITHTFRTALTKGAHELILEAKDYNGNIRRLTYIIRKE